MQDTYTMHDIFICMCIYIYVLYLYIHINICTYVFTYTRVCMDAHRMMQRTFIKSVAVNVTFATNHPFLSKGWCVSFSLSLHAYVHSYHNMHTYKHIYLNVCVCLYVYTYVWMDFSFTYICFLGAYRSTWLIDWCDMTHHVSYNCTTQLAHVCKWTQIYIFLFCTSLIYTYRLSAAKAKTSSHVKVLPFFCSPFCPSCFFKSTTNTHFPSKFKHNWSYCKFYLLPYFRVSSILWVRAVRHVKSSWDREYLDYKRRVA